MEKMRRKFEWIAEYEHEFGQPNTIFDFATIADVDTLDKKLEECREEKKRLEKNVNFKAINQLQEYEQRVSFDHFYYENYIKHV